MIAADPDRNEFKKMLWVSGSAHAVLLAATLVTTSVSKSSFFKEPMNAGPMNVIWATTVSSGKKTPENKLPPPMVQPALVPETKPEEAKVVMPENLPKKGVPKLEKPESEEEKRRRAMAEAIAGLDVKEQRPTPKPDNFPSIPGAENTGKFPAGPGGGGNNLLGDPVIAAYQAQVRKILTDNLIWLQKDKPKASALVKVDGNGNILDSKVVQSSGNKAYESAILRAIRKSSPLPPPPPKVDEMEIDFDLSRRP